VTLPGATCSTCIFWSALPVKHGVPQTRGQCRARAPWLVNRPDGAVWTSWPLTKEVDWCGNHSVLEEETL
jgi:hypothetical protein